MILSHLMYRNLSTEMRAFSCCMCINMEHRNKASPFFGFLYIFSHEYSGKNGHDMHNSFELFILLSSRFQNIYLRIMFMLMK